MRSRRRLLLRRQRGCSRTRSSAPRNRSPAGDRIAFASEAGDGWSIWVAEPDGSNVRRVTRGDGEYPAWSADGNWILFSRDTGDLVRQVLRVRPNQTGLAPVTSGRIQSWLPSAYAPRP